MHFATSELKPSSSDCLADHTLKDRSITSVFVESSMSLMGTIAAGAPHPGLKCGDAAQFNKRPTEATV